MLGPDVFLHLTPSVASFGAVAELRSEPDAVSMCSADSREANRNIVLDALLDSDGVLLERIESLLASRQVNLDCAVGGGLRLQREAVQRQLEGAD